MERLPEDLIEFGTEKSHKIPVTILEQTFKDEIFLFKIYLLLIWFIDIHKIRSIYACNKIDRI
jgi:hypothetical protein